MIKLISGKSIKQESRKEITEPQNWLTILTIIVLITGVAQHRSSVDLAQDGGRDRQGSSLGLSSQM
jgi:hypothetical protein